MIFERKLDENILFPLKRKTRHSTSSSSSSPDEHSQADWSKKKKMTFFFFFFSWWLRSQSKSMANERKKIWRDKIDIEKLWDKTMKFNYLSARRKHFVVIGMRKRLFQSIFFLLLLYRFLTFDEICLMNRELWRFNVKYHFIFFLEWLTDADFLSFFHLVPADNRFFIRWRKGSVSKKTMKNKKKKERKKRFSFDVI